MDVTSTVMLLLLTLSTAVTQPSIKFAASAAILTESPTLVQDFGSTTEKTFDPRAISCDVLLAFVMVVRLAVKGVNLGRSTRS